MTRFRPTIETLDARDLPSAVLADAPPSTEAAQLADLPGQPATGDEAQSLNYTKITYNSLNYTKITYNPY